MSELFKTETAKAAKTAKTARAKSKASMPRALPAQPDLAHLNPKQREAVMHTHGPLLVLAGAGSGKTRVIIHRIARLLADGVPADEILGVTFTNKAAEEMRERLAHLVGKRLSRAVHLSTFHALGLNILRKEHAAAGLRSGFTIYDSQDQISVVRELMRQVKVADRRLDPGRVLETILSTKKAGLDEVQIQWGDDYEWAAFDLYPRYCAQMRAFNAVDFDDLILKTHAVLQNQDVCARWQQRFSYVLVDEYQDTSPDQLALLKVLAGQKRNVCAVGDDDQSIYGWRGAAADNILAFGRHFEGTCEVILDQNYRSTNHILRAANAVIHNNSGRKAKALWSAGGDGAAVRVVSCDDAEDEAGFVTNEILAALADGRAPRDLAVLYRSNIQGRLFEEHLSAHRVPYRVVGGQSLFDTKEVRDLMGFLSYIHNPSDEIALRRIINVPSRGVGVTSIERLSRFAESKKCSLHQAVLSFADVPGLSGPAKRGLQAFVPLMQQHRAALCEAKPGNGSQAVKALIADLHLEDAVVAADDADGVRARRLQNLKEIPRTMAIFEARLGQDRSVLADFVHSRALQKNRETDEVEPNEVTLMTLHGAKGLEFCDVYLVGLEEEILPHKKSIEDAEGDIREERRLCYVGMTRAQKRLVLSHCRRRGKNGRFIERTPSRFIAELPDEVKAERRLDSEESRADSDATAANFFAQMREILGDDDAA